MLTQLRPTLPRRIRPYASSLAIREAIHTIADVNEGQIPNNGSVFHHRGRWVLNGHGRKLKPCYYVYALLNYLVAASRSRGVFALLRAML